LLSSDPTSELGDSESSSNQKNDTQNDPLKIYREKKENLDRRSRKVSKTNGVER